MSKQNIALDRIFALQRELQRERELVGDIADLIAEISFLLEQGKGVGEGLLRQLCERYRTYQESHGGPEGE